MRHRVEAKLLPAYRASVDEWISRQPSTVDGTADT